MAGFDDLPERAFAPRLERYQGDTEDPYSTADILAQMKGGNTFTDWLRQNAPEGGVPDDSTPWSQFASRVARTGKNITGGAMNTVANWFDWKPKVGPDTIAPTGVGFMGTALAHATGALPKNAVGVFGGELAHTADHAALARAKEMASGGIDRDTIWKETGWGLGPDGKWRFEIDDSGAKVKPYNFTPQEAVDELGHYAMVDRHPFQIERLNNIKPLAGMSEAEILAKWKEGGQGIVEAAKSGDMTLANRLMQERVPLDHMLDAMSARKYGPMSSFMEHEKLYDAYPRAGELHTRLDPDMAEKGHYFRGDHTKGEQIALNEMKSYNPDNRSTALHELQHQIQQDEGFARGANPSKFEPERRALLNQLQESEAVMRMRSLIDAGTETPASAAEWVGKGAGLNPDRLLRLHQEFPGEEMANRVRYTQEQFERADPMEKYRRTAGEVEARNVQTRKDMSAEQRRSTPPWKTQDVPDEQQIVRFGGSGPQMSSLPMDEASRAQKNSLDQANASTRPATGLGHPDSVPGALPERAFGDGEAARLARAREMGYDLPAYHATAHEFSEFKPGWRGASFFASTPAGAERGASYGNMDKYGAGKTADRIMPVMLRSEYIKGLNLDPAEKAWWSNLPERAKEADIPTLMKDQPGFQIGHWYNVFDEVQLPDGTFEYVKKPIPSKTLDDVARTGEDVYGSKYLGTYDGEQFMAKNAKERGMDGFILSDEGGVSIGIADPTKIRSKFAAFDPSQAHSANILAAKSDNQAGTAINALGEAQKTGLPERAFGKEKVRGYHGTLNDFDRFKTKEDYMIDRALGPHFAADPEVSNSFIMERINGKEIGPKEGGRMMPVDIEGRFLDVPQPKFDWAKDNPDMPSWRAIVSDQTAIEKMAAVEAYKRDPDLLARYLVEARRIPEPDAKRMAQEMAAGKEAFEPTEGKAYTLERFVDNFGGKPYNDADRALMVELARQSWLEQGYQGLRYKNTSPMEMATAKDPTAYVMLEPNTVKSATSGETLFSKPGGLPLSDREEEAPERAFRPKKR